MKIEKSLFTLLNDQYNKEIASAIRYHDFAAQAEAMGMQHYYELLEDHYEEELEHAEKFYHFLIDKNQTPFVTNDSTPGKVKRFTNPHDIAKEVLAIEEDVTKLINAISDLASKQSNNEVYEFNQWFVKEQIEEEKLCTDILDFFKLSKDLLLIDKEIGELHEEMEKK